MRKILMVAMMCAGTMAVSAQTTVPAKTSTTPRKQASQAAIKPRVATTQSPSAKSKNTTVPAAPSTVSREAVPSTADAAAQTPVTGPIAIFSTTAGKLTCTLFPDQAPVTVANFIGLADGSKVWMNPFTRQRMQGVPLYDGTFFHRIIPNFMIQGGDPEGTGQGSPGYRFEDEFSPELRFDRPGRLAMANTGPGTNGSQFFITEAPTPWLDDKHTIFGQCDEASVELVKKIARMATDPRSNLPESPVMIMHIQIVGGPEKPKPAAEPKAAKPATQKPAATRKPAGAGTSKTAPKPPSKVQ